MPAKKVKSKVTSRERIEKINELAEKHNLTYGQMQAQLRRERMKLDAELRKRYLSEADSNEGALS